MIPSVLRSSVVNAASVTLVAVPAIASSDDCALLSADERQRATRFAVEKPRASFITARAALRRLLADTLRCEADAIRFDADAQGRPFLVDPIDSTLDFNVSHSEAMAAIAIARGGRVGVDVEWHGRDTALRDLVPEVMGARESALLATLEGDEFTRAFFGCWTRKEALVKAHGIGISFPLRNIDIPTAASGRAIRATLGPDSIWSVSTFAPQPDYTLSVALAGEPLRSSQQPRHASFRVPPSCPPMSRQQRPE